MQDFISEGIARLAGMSSQAVFHFKQAMGGGKTHLLVGFGFLAKHPSLRSKYCSGLLAARAFKQARIAVFNGRNDPDHFFWEKSPVSSARVINLRHSGLGVPRPPTKRGWLDLFDHVGGTREWK